MDTVLSAHDNSHVRPVSHSGRSSSSSGGGSRRSHRQRLRASYQSASQGKKRYAAHVPLYPNTQDLPAKVLLDPIPNSRILSMALVSRSLVTTHKNGIRLYRQRVFQDPERDSTATSSGGDQPPSATPSGVWDLLESREHYNLKDAYMCVGPQPVLHDSTAVQSVYSRYFCVASGDDRTTHSVCVLSTAAHFVLHHELHGRNRIVAMHFSLVAFEPMRDRRLTPIVLSVDEVGGVCIYHVERDIAFKLEKCPIPLSDLLAEAAESSDYDLTNADREAMLAAYVRDPALLREDYHVEGGVATQATLTGPCVELCNACGNVCSLSGKSSAGLTALSVVVACRAKDIQQDDNGNDNVNGNGGAASPSSEAHRHEAESAELRITFIRVLWSPQGAFLMHDRTLTREVAPVDVCEVGPVLSTRPYLVGAAMTIRIGRPRLRVWRLMGCTGDVLRTLRVYNDTEGSGLGSRSTQEYFTQWVPLGRHTLIQDAASSWFCIAALTDDGTILLLGQDRQRNTVGGGNGGSEVVSSSTPSPVDRGLLDERMKLESWLDDVETPSAAAAAAARDGGNNNKDNEEDEHTRSDSHTPRTRQEKYPCDYAVLLVLYSTSGASSMGRSGVVGQMMADLLSRGSSLLVFLTDQETVLRVPLPFATHVSPADQSPADKNVTLTPTPNRQRPAQSQGVPPVLSLWDTTRDMLSSSTSRWAPGSFLNAAAAATTTTLAAQPAKAESVPTSDGYGLNIIRPLASAMYYFSSNHVDSDDDNMPLSRALPTTEGSVAAVPSTSAAAGTANDPLSIMADVDDAVGEERGTTHSEREFSPPPDSTKSAVRSSSPSGDCGAAGRREGSPPQRVEAVFVHLLNSAPRRHRHRAKSSSGAVDQAVTVTEPPNTDSNAKAYVQQTVQKLLSDTEKANANISESHTVNAMVFRIQAQIAQLVAVEEPTERGALNNAWRDTNNSLYIAFSLERDAMQDRAALHVAALRAQAMAERQLYLRPCLADAMDEGTYSGRFFTQFNMLTTSNSNDQDSASKEFDWKLYFTTGRVPQFLTDMQESDKCRFELEDLRRQHREALQGMDPFDTVTIFQNEEKVAAAAGGSGGGEWMPHPTFAYDDVDGNVIDLLDWNASADKLQPDCWEWVASDAATTTTVAAGGDREHSPPPRVQHLRKELQGWDVGPWQYASHWPTLAEANIFEWASTETPQAVVRRRPLKRRRVNLPLLLERKKLEEVQLQEVEALRTDLGI